MKNDDSQERRKCKLVKVAATFSKVSMDVTWLANIDVKMPGSRQQLCGETTLRTTQVVHVTLASITFKFCSQCAWKLHVGRIFKLLHATASGLFC